MKTIRQQLIEEVARKIDHWNFPIWLAIQENKVGWNCTILETIEIDGKSTQVRKQAIFCNHEQAILNQVQEFLSKTVSGNYGYWKAYFNELSPKAETRLINDIVKQLRYKIYA